MNHGMNLTSSTASWKSSDGVPDQFPAGLRVLVVDDDPTCLMILEKMLRNCKYEVTKCSRAEVALKYLRDSRDGFDVVISDVHMPDMDGFKLLEQVGLEMDLPVIMMSADDSKSVVMKGVTHGACDYLIKPVRMEALKNIWQHVVRKRKHEWKDKDLEQSGSIEDGERLQKPSEDADYSSSANEGNWRGSKKRKDEEDDLEDRDDTSALKKPRVVWSVELHQQFVTAVNQLGIDKAVPKKILELMNVPGLTRENVASHLQKYRLYLRRLSGQHQNGLGNSFMGPQDTPFGPITSFSGIDLQALASSGQLPPQSLASIQAAAFSRAKCPSSASLIDQRNMFSYDNSKIRFVEGQQQHNNGKNANLLHGIPTNMDSKQLVALQQSARPFSNMNMNMNVRSQSGQSNSLLTGQSNSLLTGQSNSLLTQMVQPKSRTQILNEIGRSSHSSSVGQPVISQAVAGPVSSRYGIENIRGPAYTSLSQPPMGVDFSRTQRLAQEELNPEIKGSRGFVPNFDVFSELNQNRSDDWALQSVGSSFESPQHSHAEVAPSVLVQPGFSSGHISSDLGPQLTSCQSDSSLRHKPDVLPDMSFQNGLFPNQFVQDDLMSAIFKQEGTLPVENEFGFEEYHLDNLPV